MSATRQNTGDARGGVIVLVASLGGLHALSTVLSGLPESFPACLLVVQHGRRDDDSSRLPALLAKRTELPVHRAERGDPALRAGVTVVPGGFDATLGCTHGLELTAADGATGGDALMKGVAAAFGPAVIGVVLTGLLSDGTEGVRAVKRHGGRVLAQDPETARASSMPANAIATGCVDFVLPLERVAPALTALTMAPGGAELLAVPTPPWASLHA
jgi:two-component system chemotaxis response regulator CheB